jgi:hypothetical protein
MSTACIHPACIIVTIDGFERAGKICIVWHPRRVHNANKAVRVGPNTKPGCAAIVTMLLGLMKWKKLNLGGVGDTQEVAEFWLRSSDRPQRHCFLGAGAA